MSSKKIFFKWKNPIELSPNVKKRQLKTFRQEFNRITIMTDKKGPGVSLVDDFLVEGVAGQIPIRLYVPTQVRECESAAILFFHGGGYILGSLDTHDGLCRRLAQSAQMRVLSVDYRLAPEHKFPAAIEDAESVISKILEQGKTRFSIDLDRLIVAGDSAGGGMAAVIAQRFRQEIKYQLLLYPLLQLQNLKGYKQPAIKRIGGNLVLTQIRDLYLNSREEVHDLRASPLFQKDLKGLAPAFIITCGTDPLKVEGKVYAKQLESVGVTVFYEHYKKVPHGFCTNTKLFSEGKKAIEKAGQTLAKALNP